MYGPGDFEQREYTIKFFDRDGHVTEIPFQKSVPTEKARRREGERYEDNVLNDVTLNVNYGSENYISEATFTIHHDFGVKRIPVAREFFSANGLELLVENHPLFPTARKQVRKKFRVTRELLTRKGIETVVKGHPYPYGAQLRKTMLKEWEHWERDEAARRGGSDYALMAIGFAYLYSNGFDLS